MSTEEKLPDGAMPTVEPSSAEAEVAASIVEAAPTQTAHETPTVPSAATTAEVVAPAAEAPAAPVAEAAAEAAPVAEAEAAAVADSGSATEPDPRSDAEPGSETDPASASATADGEPKKRKRRRRRRRKKKPEGEGDTAEASADGSTPAPTSASGASQPLASQPSASQPGASQPIASQPRASKPDGRKPRKKGKPPEKPAFNLGDEVFGRVTSVTKDAILIDVAGKAVGLYDREQLIQVPPRPGEQFIAKVKGFSMRGGMLMLGPEPYDLGAARTELREHLEADKPVMCWVTGVIKGGLEVDFKGVRAFAPASHVDLKPNADLVHMLGEKMEFIVSHYAKKGRDVVVSRKQMLEAEYNEERAEHLAKLQPDMQVKAVVRTVLNWGAFAALPEYGNLEGVIHMSEASHDRGARLEKIFKVGAEIDVKVLKVDEKGKLWLSHKACIDDPWSQAIEKWPIGSIHTLKVVRLTEFGAFIQLEPGIDGLCHVADLSPTPIDHPKEVVKEGDDFEVIVAHIDDKTRKVTLHPAPPEAERDVPRIRRLQKYQEVQVVVTQIQDAGLGVRILGMSGRHGKAFIPAGQTGTPRGTDLRKTFPLGTRIQAKVIDIDNRRGDARLSVRALKEDAEKQAYREYRKKVQREATFGTFGDLLKGKLGG